VLGFRPRLRRVACRTAALVASRDDAIRVGNFADMNCGMPLAPRHEFHDALVSMEPSSQDRLRVSRST
jgi:hypothetical protein